jgi:hypothetical protein
MKLYTSLVEVKYLGILFKKLNYARPSHFEADAFFPEINPRIGK